VIPLLPEQGEVHGALQDLVQAAIVLRPVHLIERLFTHSEARHEAVAQEMAEAKELIGIAVGIDHVFLGP
jgi:hypothetical protein